jgi:hypothetical protein
MSTMSHEREVIANRDKLIRELDIIRATLVDVKREHDCLIDGGSLKNNENYNSTKIYPSLIGFDSKSLVDLFNRYYAVTNSRLLYKGD